MENQIIVAYKRLWLPITLAILVFLGNAVRGVAQVGIQFLATATKKEITAGGSVQVGFKLVGSAGGQLRQPDFGPFRAVGGTSETSGMQIINGNMQGHHTWSFNLVAPATTGTYTIPAAKATVNGRTYESEPLTLRVVAANAPPGSSTPGRVPPNGDPRIFITTEFSTSKPYVGQQVIVTVNIYTQTNIAGLDMVRLPKPALGNLIELEKFDANQTEAYIGGQRYVRQPIYAAQYFPDAQGKINFEAARLNTSINQGGFFAPTRVLQLESEPIALEVRPLPEPQPQGFSGLVGNYRVELTKTRDSLAAGEASVLQMEVRGNGNPRFMAPPSIEVPAGIETFDPAIKTTETFENGQEGIHAQALEYTFATKQQGDFACMARMVWFDPDSNKYVQWQQSIQLEVGPGNGSTAQPILPNGSTSSGLSQFFKSSKGIGLLSLLAAALLGFLYFWLNKKRSPANGGLHDEENIFIPEKKENNNVVLEQTNAQPRSEEEHSSYQPKARATPVEEALEVPESLPEPTNENHKQYQPKPQLSAPIDATRPTIPMPEPTTEGYERYQPTQQPAPIPAPISTLPVTSPPAAAAPETGIWATLALMAQNDGPTRPFYTLLLDTVKESLAQQLGITMAQIDLYTTLDRMQQRGCTLQQQDELNWLWGTCEQALYAAQEHVGERERALNIGRGLRKLS